MWSTLLALSLVAGLDPLRLAWTLLVVSRPRPIQNLLAYWAGTMTVSVPYILIPLTVLNVTPALSSFVDGLSSSSIFRHINLALGVLVLSIAALMIVRLLKGRRHQEEVLTASGSTSALAANTSPMPLEGHAAAVEERSAIQRLRARAKNAWENGALWVAFVIGVLAVPPLDASLFILAVTVTSGADIGTQLLGAFVFVIGTLIIVEILLVSYLFSPTKSEAMLRWLHDWSLAHRRQILVAMLVVVGGALLARGMGII